MRNAACATVTMPRRCGWLSRAGSGRFSSGVSEIAGFGDSHRQFARVLRSLLLHRPAASLVRWTVPGDLIVLLQLAVPVVHELLLVPLCNAEDLEIEAGIEKLLTQDLVAGLLAHQFHDVNARVRLVRRDRSLAGL